MSLDTENWEGVKGSIGEHQTTGSRAWCLDCHEWCYPSGFCRCCYPASEEFKVCPTCDGEGYVLGDHS